MRKNQNIRAVFINKEIAVCADKFLAAMEKQEVKVVLLHEQMQSSEDWLKVIETAKIPQFHCVACDSTALGIESAKKAGLRTVAVQTKELENVANQFVACLDDIDVDIFLESGRVKAMPICETAIIEEGFARNDVNHMETLFALGNGYMGLRGTYDETDDEINEVCGMYINGIFATIPYEHLCWCVGFAVQDEYTVNLADWRIINLYIDGEKACFSKENIKEHKRVLDMQNGAILRQFIFETKTGKHAAVESTRIVNMDEVHSAEVQYKVRALDFEGEIKLELQVTKCTEIKGNRPCKVTKEKSVDNLYVFEQEVETTGQKVATAICHEVEALDFNTSIQNEGNVYSYIVNANVKKDEMVSVSKYVAFSSSMDDVEDIEKWAIELAHKNQQMGFETLKDRQAEFWNQYWEKGDVSVKGNPSDAQAIRYSLFQLRQQLATVNACSIGATGLTGPGYSGKVFWDTEMYLMPYYNFTYPKSQKELLMYRYRILNTARDRAKEFGMPGAMYSWCSIDGIETSVVFEASTAEYHLNSDIAYAVWRYVDTTQDKEFLHQYGAEIVFETAKFMYARGCFIPARGNKFCMNAVCGPDEYACGVNNNCYTNLMLQWHLHYAEALAQEMKREVPEVYKALAERLNLGEEDLVQWKKAADNIYYKYNEELGVHEQDDSFIYQDPVDMSTLPINRDIRWAYHPLDLWRKQVSKQADVVLINFMRGDLFTFDEKLRDYEYYEPRCNHGSSLSTAIHAIMACELDKPEAYEFFRCSAYMDIGDFKHNTQNGLHIACLGGVWMTVVNGYLGMRHYADGIHFSPRIPIAWNEYECHITYRNATMKVSVKKDETVFQLIEGEKLEFFVNGERLILTSENVQVCVETIIS